MNARSACSALGLVLLWGCDPRFAQTAELPAPEGAEAGTPEPTCGPTLAERLELTRIPVDFDVRYKRAGYDGFPDDERIAFAVAPSGEARIAWLDDAERRVHVTPLTAALGRRGADTVVEGTEIGGLVAHDDGFAVLVLRDDPGEPLADPAMGGIIARAQVLVRVREGTEVFAAPLTGTASIAERGPGRDCGVGGGGRLAWNGARYGAYFPVHGCQGDPHAPYYADKLVYLDDGGHGLPGGWDWGCSISHGMRLIAEQEDFTAFCLADTSPFPGLNLFVEGREPAWLAAEIGEVGYSTARFGSAVKLDMGYLVAWTSRGVAEGGQGRPEPARAAPDVAIAFLDADRIPRGTLWLDETRDTAEANLHVAAYGPDRLLFVWDRIEVVRCDAHTCFGRYEGTRAALGDLREGPRGPPGGGPQPNDELLPAPPNGPDDIAVLPNGDLAWAYVEEDRAYDRPLPLRADGSPDVPPRREITVARLRYCPREAPR